MILIDIWVWVEFGLSLGWVRVEFGLSLGWVQVEFGLSSGWVWVEFGMSSKLYYRSSGSYWYCFLFYICLPCFFWRRANNGSMAKTQKGANIFAYLPTHSSKNSLNHFASIYCIAIVILGICFDQWFCSFGNFKTSYTY